MEVVAIILLGVITVGVAVALRWLTTSGAFVAVIVGLAISTGLGVPGLAMLVFFFVSSSWLTRASRRHRVEDPVADADASGRTAAQVLANAGVAAVGALLALSARFDAGLAIGVGALAAATADTWASEIGQWARGATRLCTTWEVVEPGTDGGVSVAGTVGGLAASGALASIGALTQADGRLWLVGFAAGVAGLLADSIAGATLEGRFAKVDNDAVNLIGTLTGGLVALALVSAGP